jgi:hypothetical protein
MAALSISRAWDESKAIFARDGRLLVAVALALVVLPTVIVGLVVPSDPAEGGGLFSGLVQTAAALIAMIGQLALIRLAIGPATTVGAAISHGVRRFPSLLGAMLLLALLIFVLLIPIVLILAATGTVDLADPARTTAGPAAAIIGLLVLAAIAVSVKLIMTAPVASAEAAGPIAILKRSWTLTNGHYWRLLGFLLLILILAIVLMITAGAIGGVLGTIISPDLEVSSLGALVLALFVGIAQGIFTVLTAVMIARIYLQLSGRESIDVTVPKTGT